MYAPLCFAWLTFATAAVTRTLQFRLEPDGAGILTAISTTALLVLIPMVLATLFETIRHYRVLRNWIRAFSLLTVFSSMAFLAWFLISLVWFVFPG